MAFGDLEESIVNSTFIITCGPARTVVRLPLVTRFTHLTRDWSIGFPSMTPETMGHSPSNSVPGDSDLAAGFLEARNFLAATAGSPLRTRVSIAHPLPAR